MLWVGGHQNWKKPMRALGPSPHSKIAQVPTTIFNSNLIGQSPSQRPTLADHRRDAVLPSGWCSSYLLSLSLSFSLSCFPFLFEYRLFICPWFYLSFECVAVFEYLICLKRVRSRYLLCCAAWEFWFLRNLIDACGS